MTILLVSFQKKWAETDLWKKISLVAFLLNFFLVFQSFLPNLAQINPWDEADYVNAGRFFLEGRWPPLSWSPLTALFYGFTYLVFQESPFWFLYSITVGRITAFILLWIATYLIAKELSALTHPLIFIGVAFITPLFTGILANPSDAFFAAITGLAFGQFLSFYHKGKASSLIRLSTLLGLAALTRNDGIVLFFCIIPITFFITKRHNFSFSHWLPRFFIPFLTLVGGYLLLYGAFRGTFEIGTEKRSYIAFVQGHQIIYEKERDCPYSFQKCAVLDATNKFGTAEENNNSVIQAIIKNPAVFLPRVIKMTSTLPDVFFDGYGRQFSYILIFMSALGIFKLIISRNYFSIFILISWSAYLGVYFLTFFRYGYLQNSFYIPFTLSAIGILFLVDTMKTKKGFLLLLIIFTIITAGVFANLPSIYFNFSILAITLLMGQLLAASELSETSKKLIPVLLLLSASLIIRGNYYPVITGRDLAQFPEEQALLIMQNEFDKNDLIAAGARGVVYAANMEYFSLGDDRIDTDSSEKLYEQLKNAGVSGIYVDHHLSSNNRNVWVLIESEISTRYEILYTGKNGSILVLKVSE